MIAPRLATGSISNAARPDQRHILARWQRTAAFDRDYLFVGSGRGALGLRQASSFKEVAQRPIIIAQISNQLCRNVLTKHIKRDLFANSVNRTVASIGDRLARRRRVRRDEENLILLNVAVIAAGKDSARGRPASINGKRALASDTDAARAFEVITQFDRAGQPSGECAGKFMNKSLRINPATSAADGAGDPNRRGSARIAQRHHVFGEAQRETVNHARIAASGARNRERDLRGSVAKRDDRCGDEKEASRKRQQCFLHYRSLFVIPAVKGMTILV